MIFIKDICEYFLEECKTAYIDYYTETVCFSPNEYTIEIPKAFKRIDLLREYIEANESKSFIRKTREMSDIELRDLYHGLLYDWSSDDIAVRWTAYAKDKIFDYAEKWCELNNFKCSIKDDTKLCNLEYLFF